MKDSITISTIDLQKAQGYDWFRNYQANSRRGVIIQHGPIAARLREAGADLSQTILIEETPDGQTRLTFTLMPHYDCGDAD